MYIVSACLVGENVKYNGGNNYNQGVVDFLKDKNYVLICPEMAGGLEAPRDPAERIEGRIVDRAGRDLTEAFNLGARRCWEKVLCAGDPEKIEGAILRFGSPSCGVGKIYDGTFSGVIVDGDGVFAELLRSKGIPLMTDKDFG